MRQVELEVIRALVVRLALEVHDLRLLHVKHRADDLDLPPAHRLAEKVVALHRARDVLAGQVKAAVGADLDGELGQHVGLDVDRLFGGRVAQADGDLVIAVDHFVGQDEIGGGHAERGRLDRLAKDLVALGVFDQEVDVGVLDRFHVQRRKRQRAHVDGLRRLVDRLVGRQEQLVAPLDGDRLLDLVAADLERVSTMMVCVIWTYGLGMVNDAPTVPFWSDLPVKSVTAWPPSLGARLTLTSALATGCESLVLRTTTRTAL